MVNIALSVTALLSLIFFGTATLSAAQEEKNHEYVLARVQHKWIVDLVVADADEQIHYCGLVLQKIIAGNFVAFELAAIPENVRAYSQASCPRNSRQGSVTIKQETLLAIDVLYQSADIYDMKTDRRLAFKAPVKKSGMVFEDVEIPIDFEIRLKSPALLPGRYLPELSFAAGYSGFFGLNEMAPMSQFSGLWFIHPRFAAWHIRADVAYWAKAQNVTASYVLPDRLVESGLGLSYRWVAHAQWIFHAALSAVSVFYRYFDEAYQWAHRPALRAALTIEWAFMRANRDAHKVSLLAEPQYTHFLNKTEGVADWTKQWALMFGVRYAF